MYFRECFSPEIALVMRHTRVAETSREDWKRDCMDGHGLAQTCTDRHRDWDDVYMKFEI